MPAANEISPQGLAFALTLLEADKLRQIAPSDYLAHLCGCPGYTNVQAAITVNSKILLWIKQSLLHYDALTPRASVWKFFINTAEVRYLHVLATSRPPSHSLFLSTGVPKTSKLSKPYYDCSGPGFRPSTAFDFDSALSQQKHEGQA